MITFRRRHAVGACAALLAGAAAFSVASPGGSTPREATTATTPAGAGEVPGAEETPPTSAPPAIPDEQAWHGPTDRSAALGELGLSLLPGGFTIRDTIEWDFDAGPSIFATFVREDGLLARVAVYNAPRPDLDFARSVSASRVEGRDVVFVEADSLQAALVTLGDGRQVEVGVSAPAADLTRSTLEQAAVRVAELAEQELAGPFGG